MTIEQLRKAHRAQPFQPFTLHLTDGRSFHVPHPEFLFAPPGMERTVVVVAPDGLYEGVDLLLVTSLTLGDGRARRRQRRRT